MFYQPRRGGSRAATRRVFRREPPRLRQLRMLRDICLIFGTHRAFTDPNLVPDDIRRSEVEEYQT